MDKSQDEKEREEAVEKGKWLAQQLNMQIGFLSIFNHGIQPYDVVIATAILFAGIITGVDNQITEQEAEGGPPPDDETRIVQFSDLVRDFCKQMRDHRTEDEIDSKATPVDRKSKKKFEKGVM